MSEATIPDDWFSLRVEDLRDWDDTVLKSEYDEALVVSADIKRQLDDDVEEGSKRGDEWRKKARTARRVACQFADRVWREMERRKSDLTSGNLRVALQQMQVKNDRLRAELQRLSTDRAANRTQCEMFVVATHRVFSRDECDKIWQRAREMHPDAPAWTEAPRGKGVAA
jgi:hypothetical protein